MLPPPLVLLLAKGVAWGALKAYKEICARAQYPNDPVLRAGFKHALSQNEGYKTTFGQIESAVTKFLK